VSLSREQVLGHALAILDQYGFADLSMRRLATSLGVQPGALYWHFANKQTLLTAVAEAILSPRPPVCVPTGSAGTGSAPTAWEPAVRTWACGLREALLSHRDGAEVVASVLAVRPATLDPAGEIAAVLMAHAMAAAQARAAGMALLHFVIGHTVDEQGNAAMAEFGVAQAVDTEAQERFAAGLDLFVAGLGVRLSGGGG
jgi:TetR/AcrR family tetracycline transcriptional repressor